MTIVASPSRVCADHGLEFWNGLLAYSRGRSGPCVKLEALCHCRACEEQAASRRRASAITRVGTSPGDHVGFTMPLVA